MTEKSIFFNPDWVSPPGDTIVDLLEERSWTQAQLADRLGYTVEFISQLVSSEASITEETAFQLEQVLGSSAKFWLKREFQYCNRLAQLKDVESLQSQVCKRLLLRSAESHHFFIVRE